MQLTAENKLKKLIVVGDRVLIRLKKPNEKTGSGLYLPPGVQEKEQNADSLLILAALIFDESAAVSDPGMWLEKNTALYIRAAQWQARY